MPGDGVVVLRCCGGGCAEVMEENLGMVEAFAPSHWPPIACNIVLLPSHWPPPAQSHMSASAGTWPGTRPLGTPHEQQACTSTSCRGARKVKGAWSSSPRWRQARPARRDSQCSILRMLYPARYPHPDHWCSRWLYLMLQGGGCGGVSPPPLRA